MGCVGVSICGQFLSRRVIPLGGLKGASFLSLAMRVSEAFSFLQKVIRRGTDFPPLGGEVKTGLLSVWGLLLRSAQNETFPREDG